MSLYQLAIVFLFGIFFQVAHGISKCDDYECVSETEFKVKFLPGIQKCNNPTPLCNTNCPAGTAVASACTDATTLCPVTCAGDSVQVGSIHYPCGPGLTCNADPMKTTCNYCICKNEGSFECINTNTVNVNGLIQKCPSKTVCNTNKQYPCSFCVRPNGDVKTTELNWLTEPHL